MRIRYCVTSSREVIRPCSIAVRISGMVASTTLNLGLSCAMTVPDREEDADLFIQAL